MTTKWALLPALLLAAGLGVLLGHLLFGECFPPPGPEIFCGG
jgi:hypothetical protein